MYANNKSSCLIQKTSNGKIEYNTKYGKNCTLLRPITLTDVNVMSDNGEEVLNGGKSCVLNSSDEPLLYYNNIEIINNKKIKHNESYSIKCKTGYNTTDGKEFIYKCNDGELIFDDENSSGDEDCKIKVEFFSPVNGRAEVKYFNEGEQVKCTIIGWGGIFNDIDSQTSKLCRVYNGNTPYIVAYEPQAFTVKLVNEDVKDSCHGSYIPRDLTGDINTAANVTGVNNEISKTRYKSTIKNNGETLVYTNGNGQATLKCIDGKWINEKGSRTYNYTGGVQTFNMISGGERNLTLEAWGGQGGGCSACGAPNGGYTKGEGILNSILYVVVGGNGSQYISASNTGQGFNGGGAGGGSNGDRNGFSGGGATHIATVSGVLSSLSSNKDSILVVAGGGGGTQYCTSRCSGISNTRGIGGGNNLAGEDGTYDSNSVWCSGYSGKTTNIEVGSIGHYDLSNCSTNSTSGGFGFGGNADDINCDNDFASGGGGGGYYGGGGGGRNCSITYSESGGGGGSGYCKSGLVCSGSKGASTVGKAIISWGE